MPEKQKSVSKKQYKQSAIAILLVLAVLVAGAFAFLTATDSKTNVFTVGKVSVQLWEDFDANNDGEAETYNATPKLIRFQGDMIPGQTIKKAPYVINDGNTDVYLFVAVGIPVDTPENLYGGNGTYVRDDNIVIPVKAFAIQTGYNYGSTIDEAYSMYFGEEKMNSIFGAETATPDAYEEMFQIYHDVNGEKVAGPNSNWISIATRHTDKYNYTIYKYVANDQAVLPKTETSSKVFDYVKFNKNIGGEMDISLPGSNNTQPSNPDNELAAIEQLYLSTATFAADTTTLSETPTDGYRIQIGDYIYAYNSYYEDAIIHDFVVSNDANFRGGWGVKYIGSSENPEPMCNTVSGYPVITSTYCYAHRDIATIPSLPVQLKNTENTFYCLNGSVNSDVSGTVVFPPHVTSMNTISDCRFGKLDLTYAYNLTTLTNINIDTLKELIIGPYVTNINSETQSILTNAHLRLERIVVSPDNPVYDSRENCNAIIETETNTLIAGCKNTVIPEGITTIANFAFYSYPNYGGLPEFTHINLPDSLLLIGQDAFYGCLDLTSVTYKGNVYTDETHLREVLNNNGVFVTGGAFDNTGLSA